MSEPPAIATCDPGESLASGDVIVLHFPCGPELELHPVERTVTLQGDERLNEIMDVFLAGPSARERDAGFGSLLGPGDIDIVANVDGRLVLDFPVEVNNVSTSAGTRAVLESVRRTFLAIDGVEEIELTLRGDCAAFFEWIQAGPACHLLTDAGVVAQAPTPVPAPVPTIPGSPTGPEIVTGSPVTAQDDDGVFRLSLEARQDRYRAGQVIDVMAMLTYLGPDPSTVALGPGTGLIGFGIESDDPAIRISPAFTSDCAPWKFTRDEVVVYPFEKSGGFGEDEPLASFYRAYFADPELRLPAGTWRIFAGGGFYEGADCGDAFPYHSLSASLTIVVEP